MASTRMTASEIMLNQREGFDRIKKQEWLSWIQNDIAKRLWTDPSVPRKYEKEYNGEWVLAKDEIAWPDYVMKHWSVGKKSELEQWVPDELFEP